MATLNAELGQLGLQVLAWSPLGLCYRHEPVYQEHGRPGAARLPSKWYDRFERTGRLVPVGYGDEAAFGRWCRDAFPVTQPGTVNLRGLALLAAAEIRWGMFALPRPGTGLTGRCRGCSPSSMPAAAWTAWPAWIPAAATTRSATPSPRCSPGTSPERSSGRWPGKSVLTKTSGESLGLQATAIQCWSSMQKNFGVNVCTIMSMMSEQMMPSACEVDIAGVISMYALQLLK